MSSPIVVPSIWSIGLAPTFRPPCASANSSSTSCFLEKVTIVRVPSANLAVPTSFLRGFTAAVELGCNQLTL